MNKTQKWNLRSGSIHEFVLAQDALDACDCLRHRPADDFGLIVIAEPDEAGEDDSFPIRTSLLMFRWRRDEDARAFVKRMIEEGMPDTTQADLASCGRK